tara:strand:+ start:313 stop:660 length:348 start_codon:yes stop_codon:yes gene_type:complete
MDSLNLVVVYHPRCRASTDFLIKVSKIVHADIEYINIESDKIETELPLDTVPLMIINNDPSKIFKGKEAFDKVDEILNTPVASKKEAKTSTLKYGRSVNFVEQTDKKEKIDLSKR